MLANIFQHRIVESLYDAGFSIRFVFLMTGIAAALAWLIVPTLQPGYEYGVDRHGGIAYCNLKLLGSFPFNDMTGKIEDVPAVIRQLDGKKVAIDGFMRAGYNSDDKASSFQLLDDAPREGGPPRVQLRVFVSSPTGKPVEVTDQEIRAIGILHIKIVHDPDTGKILSLFSMDLNHKEQL